MLQVIKQEKVAFSAAVTWRQSFMKKKGEVTQTIWAFLVRTTVKQKKTLAAIFFETLPSQKLYPGFFLCACDPITGL